MKVFKGRRYGDRVFMFVNLDEVKNIVLENCKDIIAILKCGQKVFIGEIHGDDLVNEIKFKETFIDEFKSKIIEL